MVAGIFVEICGAVASVPAARRTEVSEGLGNHEKKTGAYEWRGVIYLWVSIVTIDRVGYPSGKHNFGQIFTTAILSL